MAADRQIPNSTTVGTLLGDSFMDAAQEELTALFDASFLPLELTSVTVSGSPEGTAIVAVIPVPLTGSLIHGMKFTLTMGATGNTGPTTLDADGTDRDLLRYDGTLTEDGDLPANGKIPIEWDGDENAFYMLTPPRATLGASLNRQVFTSSGNWSKPNGLNDEAVVLVELWGGGGGAPSGDGGGGGGGYTRHFFRAGDLTDTVAVSIGSGGAASSGSNGGNTTFGSYLTAYGGAGAVSATSSGGGGGALSAGSGASGGGPLGGTSGGDATFGGGGGRTGNGAGGASFFGGAGGGFGANGGASQYGGGGGGGSGGGTGGASKFGGAGGNQSAAGTAPGGGAGANAVGARGEARVRVIG